MSLPAVISVSDYLSLVNFALRTVPTEGMMIEGEVVDFKISQGKWVNFDLKDEKADAKISCFMTTFGLRIPLASGMRVHVKGYAKVFERFGKLSLNVEEIELVGEGALGKAYLVLKEKLRVEGLFDGARKRTLPKFPERVGLITSAEAAAYGDFLRILGNRWGGITVLHAPVHVQGQYAVPEILNAFAMFNAMPPDERPEVLVLTRGGGSLEDLHAFNDESVARAVFSSVTPVVVGVGHERDESLSDFVADVRASTPSNAAEILVPDRREMSRNIVMTSDRIFDRLEKRIFSTTTSIDHSVAVLDKSMGRIAQDIASVVGRFGHAFDRFRLSLVATIEHVDRRRQTLAIAVTRLIDIAKKYVGEMERVLKSVDPARVLSRGYAIVRTDNHVVKAGAGLAPGTRLNIQFAQGQTEAEVIRQSQQDKLL
jgi:exodeoxyribonuclease VII large subunit